MLWVLVSAGGRGGRGRGELKRINRWISVVFRN